MPFFASISSRELMVTSIRSRLDPRRRAVTYQEKKGRKKCRAEIPGDSAMVAAHKSVTPVCLPYVSGLSFVAAASEKTPQTFSPDAHDNRFMHLWCTLRCIDRTKFSVLTGSESDRHTLLPILR